MSDPIVCLRESVWHQWSGSPHSWILTKSPQQQERFWKRFFAGLCAAHGFDVLRSTKNVADNSIEGYQTAVASSMLGRFGSYTFRLTKAQNCDILVCLGLSPLETHAWIFRKEKIPFKHLSHQHGGARGRDTWWMTVKPDNSPEWLHPQSGRLADVYRVLAGLRRRQ